jgi:hypothetical protein
MRHFDASLTHNDMQHPQPEDVLYIFLEFPPRPQSFHLHSQDFRQQEVITVNPVDPRSLYSLQPTARSVNASVAWDPQYGIPSYYNGSKVPC